MRKILICILLLIKSACIAQLPKLQQIQEDNSLFIYGFELKNNFQHDIINSDNAPFNRFFMDRKTQSLQIKNQYIDHFYYKKDKIEKYDFETITSLQDITSYGLFHDYGDGKVSFSKEISETLNLREWEERRESQADTIKIVQNFSWKQNFNIGAKDGSFLFEENKEITQNYLSHENKKITTHYGFFLPLDFISDNSTYSFDEKIKRDNGVISEKSKNERFSIAASDNLFIEYVAQGLQDKKHPNYSEKSYIGVKYPISILGIKFDTSYNYLLSGDKGTTIDTKFDIPLSSEINLANTLSINKGQKAFVSDLIYTLPQGIFSIHRKHITNEEGSPSDYIIKSPTFNMGDASFSTVLQYGKNERQSYNINYDLSERAEIKALINYGDISDFTLDTQYIPFQDSSIKFSHIDNEDTIDVFSLKYKGAETNTYISGDDISHRHVFSLGSEKGILLVLNYQDYNEKKNQTELASTRISLTHNSNNFGIKSEYFNRQNQQNHNLLWKLSESSKITMSYGYNLPNPRGQKSEIREGDIYNIGFSGKNYNLGYQRYNDNNWYMFETSFKKENEELTASYYSGDFIFIKSKYDKPYDSYLSIVYKKENSNSNFNLSFNSYSLYNKNETELWAEWKLMF